MVKRGRWDRPTVKGGRLVTRRKWDRPMVTKRRIFRKLE